MNRYTDRFQALRDRQAALPPRRFKTNAEVAAEVERALCPPRYPRYVDAALRDLIDATTYAVLTGPGPVMFLANPRTGELIGKSADYLLSP